jgi:hypothetical protein
VGTSLLAALVREAAIRGIPNLEAESRRVDVTTADAVLEHIATGSRSRPVASVRLIAERDLRP